MNTNNPSSTSVKTKNFFKNKNTVTAVLAILIVVVLVVGYNIRVNSAVKPVKVPFAKVTIQPRTQITTDMIGYVEVARAGIQGEVITDINQIINRYSNYNTVIPKGSMFYNTTVVPKNELPDSALYDVPKGYTLYYLSINMLTSYSNSMLPGNIIDLYISTKDSDGKALVGKLLSDVKILAVKTADGKHVFENSDEARTPAVMLFAVPEEYHLLLRKIDAINAYGVYVQNVRIVPVPNAVQYSETELANMKPNVSSKYLQEFVEEKATQLPTDILDETIPNNSNNNNNESTQNNDDEDFQTE